jgi:hypothetical protein
LFHNVSGINPMEIEQHRILAIKKSIGQIGKDTTYRRVQDKQVWNYSFEIKKKEILETKMVNGNEKYLVAFEPVWVTKSQLVFPHMIPNFQEFEKENQEKKQNLKRNLNENENKNENKEENRNEKEKEKEKEKKQKKKNKNKNKKKKENNNNNELDEENPQIDLVKKNKKSNKQIDKNENENVNNNNENDNNNNNLNNNNNDNNSNNNNEPIIVSDSEEEISLLNLDLEIVLKEKKNSNLSSQYWAKLKNENQFSWKNSLPSSLLKEWNFQKYCAEKIETIDDETWILETWVLGKKIENGNLFYHLFSSTFGIDFWKKETELQNKLFIDNWQRNHFDSQSFELKEIVEERESIFKIKCQHKIHQRTAIFDFFKADIQKFYPSLIKKKG